MNRGITAFALGIAMATVGVHAHDDDKTKAIKNNSAKHQDHATALGRPGEASNVSRTVEIAMNDTMRFKPSSIAVSKGETIRFVVKNEGRLKHEMVLGTLQELKKHAALMLKFPGMEHADPNQASVEPGKTGELIWQFTKAGKFDFACLQAGHYEAGMRGNVIVAAARPTHGKGAGRADHSH